MSRNLTKLVLAASVAVGFTVAPMLGAYAASERNVVVSNDQFQGGTIEGGLPTYDIYAGDKVIWQVINGEHTVTPKNEEKYSTWPEGTEGSEVLKEGDTFALTFTKIGRFVFICENHSTTMKGVIDVNDPNPPPPPPPPPSSTTTTTTAPPVVTTTTTSAPASSAGAKPPVGTPAPTTTTTKPEKDKKGKDDKKKEEETTTTTVAPPPPPIDLPDSAIIPVLPGTATETTTQNGVEAPMSTPEGDAIALLKPKNGGGGKAMKLLIVSGLGLGILGIGTAGYKYANRSSKYFPA